MTKTLQRTYAWFVHIFTASGAILGVLALLSAADAYHARLSENTTDFLFYMRLSFGYIAIAIIVDAIDGTLARRVDIKSLARLDGSLMDNIIDFLTYAVVPCVWIYVAGVVPNALSIITIILIMLAATFQFCQLDAKTKDHFFKGFPSYWNLAIYYLIYFQFSGISNFIIIIILCILTFVPIKYIYPSRLNYLSRRNSVKLIMFIYTLIWGAATITTTILWPYSVSWLSYIIISYLLVYFCFSLYRTLNPLQKNMEQI
ncbi:MAG: CDP-alcohol phosphatidyltransferase family protein [Francisellaceae bacterium]